MNKTAEAPSGKIRLRPGYFLGGFISAALKPDWRGEAAVCMAPGSQDEQWMHLALLEAMKHPGRSSPNPNVGCILVKDGRLLSSGSTEVYGGRHGERCALDAIATKEQLRGATAYVLLEPCAHKGKQPACAEALIAAGIKRCVIAALDPFELVAGQGLKILLQAGIDVEVGPLQRESLAWNLPFHFEMLYKRPLVAGKWAQTLNGQLADAGGSSQWISGPSARSYTHYLRQKYDAILVGAGTAIADAPSLTAREVSDPSGRQPLKIVVDPSARLTSLAPLDQQRLLERTFTSGARVLYIYSRENKAPDWLGAAGADVHLYAVADRAQLIDQMMSYLTAENFVAWYGKKVQSVFVEGGPQLLNEFLRQGRLDCFHVFVTPAFLAPGSGGIGTFSSPIPPVFAHCSTMQRYNLLATGQLGEDCLLEFMPVDLCANIFEHKLNTGL